MIGSKKIGHVLVGYFGILDCVYTVLCITPVLNKLLYISIHIYKALLSSLKKR